MQPKEFSLDGVKDPVTGLIDFGYSKKDRGFRGQFTKQKMDRKKKASRKKTILASRKRNRR